jgi:hypothetical protein
MVVRSPGLCDMEKLPPVDGKNQGGKLVWLKIVAAKILRLPGAKDN